MISNDRKVSVLSAQIFQIHLIFSELHNALSEGVETPNEIVKYLIHGNIISVSYRKLHLIDKFSIFKQILGRQEDFIKLLRDGVLTCGLSCQMVTCCILTVGSHISQQHIEYRDLI